MSTPVFIHQIRSIQSSEQLLIESINDFHTESENCCHCSCACSLHDSEDTFDLRKNEFCILKINETSREIEVFSHKRELSHTIPINSICNVYFVEQDQEQGLVILVCLPLDLRNDCIMIIIIYSS